MSLDHLDEEIESAQASLDPGAASYRYDAMRLDMLNLQRDVLTLRKDNALAWSTLNIAQAEIKALRIKSEILELLLTTICKPELRQSLAIQVADELSAKWLRHVEGGSA